MTQTEQGDRLRPSHVYLAPPDRHLLVNADFTLSLTQTERVHFARPSGDVLLESVAASCGSSTIAWVKYHRVGQVPSRGSSTIAWVKYHRVGQVPSRGSSTIAWVKYHRVGQVPSRGSSTIAQDEAGSEFFNMPRAAIETGDVDYVLDIDAIRPMLVSLVGN